MDLQLNGKVALVTGGSLGIGKGIARVLAREGVDVAICARRKDVLEAAADEIRRESGRKVLAIPADLTRREDAENFVRGAARHFGRIDVLVNNAGSAAGQNLTKALAGQYGRFNITFVAVNPGPVRTERWDGLVKAMARDMKLSYEEADRLAPRSIPLGRIAEVEEVANLVAYLASPLAHFVNGSMIEIDGGQQKPLMDAARG